MKIGLMHFRVGETDGVSLEMFKWKVVLERMGHTVFLIAGETGKLGFLKIPSISYRNKKISILKIMPISIWMIGMKKSW